MGRVIMWNVITLDGFFEGPEPWSIDFHSLVWGPDLEELSNQQLENAGLLLFGRKTFVGMAEYWSNVPVGEDSAETVNGMNSLPKAVISNTLVSADWNNTTLLKGSAVDRVRELKSQIPKDIYIFGSADLISSLLPAGLIDEIRLCIAPIIAGRGNPLFKSSESQQNLERIGGKLLPNGGILVSYRPKSA